MLYKMINNNSVSTGLILLTPTVYIVTCLNYLISIRKKIFVLRCRAIMLYKMINNNSVSTGLILLTPTVYIVTCLNYLISIGKKYLCCDAER